MTHYLTIQASGLVVDGDCSASGDLARGVIDGDSVRYSGISSGNSVNLTIKKLEVSNTTARGLYLADAANSQSAVRQITVDDVFLHDIVLDGSATPNGIYSRGRNIVVKNSIINNTGDDGISHMGKGFSLENVRIANPGITTVTGDCFAASGDVDGLSINGMSCDHQNADEKQCLVIGNVTDAPTGIVKNVSCLMPLGATKMNGITIHQGTWTVSGIYTRGGNVGISLENTFGVISASNNIVVNPTSACYVVEWDGVTSSTAVTLDGNVGRSCGSFGIRIDNTSPYNKILRNVIKGAGRCVDVFYPTQTHTDNALLDCSLSATSMRKTIISNDPSTLTN